MSAGKQAPAQPAYGSAESSHLRLVRTGDAATPYALVSGPDTVVAFERQFSRGRALFNARDRAGELIASGSLRDVESKARVAVAEGRV